MRYALLRHLFLILLLLQLVLVNASADIPPTLIDGGWVDQSVGVLAWGSLGVSILLAGGYVAITRFAKPARGNSNLGKVILFFAISFFLSFMSFMVLYGVMAAKTRQSREQNQRMREQWRQNRDTAP